MTHEYLHEIQIQLILFPGYMEVWGQFLPKKWSLTYQVMVMKSTTLICFDLEAATLVPATDFYGGCGAMHGLPQSSATRSYRKSLAFIYPTSALSLLFPHGVAQNQLNYATKADRGLHW